MRAVMLAVAEMYIKGVSTRDVDVVMREFGIESLSSSQSLPRTRSGVSRAARLLDEELAARAATAHSARSSISSLTRGMKRCAMAALCAMVRRTGKRSPGSFPDPPHHLARNAIHHAPNAAIGKQLKSIWTADDLTKAETALAALVASYRDTAPRLADWIEKNAPEGLAVFTLPEHHRKRLRTSNPIERHTTRHRAG